MNNLCQECGGKCCKIFCVFVYPRDKVFDNKTLWKLSDENKVIPINNVGCVFLRDGRCSIYNIRPLACKNFLVDGDRCKDVRNNKINKYE